MTVACELRWRTSELASGLWAAECLFRGHRPVHPDHIERLRPAAAELNKIVRTLAPGSESFWRHALPLAASTANLQMLANAVWQCLARHDVSVDVREELVRRLQTLQEGVLSTWPNLLEELPLRWRPLREQWEARGPGMLRFIARESGLNIALAAVTVVGICPVRGGGGASYPDHAAVSIEAMLANPMPELPEVARLGWLIARAGHAQAADRARLEQPSPVLEVCRHVSFVGPIKDGHDQKGQLEHAPSSVDPDVIGLALLIPTLLAGESTELTRCDEATLDLAMRHWCDLPTVTDLQRVRATVSSWWADYAGSGISWFRATSLLQGELQSVLGLNGASQDAGTK